MDQPTKKFWILLAVLTAVRLWIIGQFELSPDEAYYWTWSRHLDWAYYDQGPMLALIIRFFTLLARQASEWSVRLGAVVLSVVTSVLFFRMQLRIFHSSRAAWLAFLGLQAALLFSAGAVLMMHDSIMVCAWAGGMLAFYRAVCEDWSPGWFWGALALGLGALAKYTMAMFVPCLLLFLILSPAQRRWWAKPHLYFSGLLTLLLVTPLWLWNLQHQWASFGHIAQLGGSQQAFRLSLKLPLEFLGGQVAVMTPLLGFFSLLSPGFAWKKWKQGGEQAEGYLFLACFAAPVLLLFLGLSFQTRIYPNWPAPAYIGALGILAAWVQSRPELKGWIRASLLLGAAVTLLIHAQVLWNIVPLSGRAADSVDRIRGWRQLGEETGRRLAELNQSGSKPFLASRRYQIAAELSFYTPGQPEVELFPLEKPAGNQYRFWDHSPLLAGRDALFVCEDHWEADHLRPLFDRVDPLPVLKIRQGRRQVREILYFSARRLHAEAGPRAFARLFAPPEKVAP